MTDNLYKNMLLRRRFCKRIVLMLAAFFLSFYVSLLLFGKGPQVMHYADLHRCPACYGVSICPELYSSQIMLNPSHWTKFFNVKNIYYGYTKSNRKLLLKKLAHDWELKEFDASLCKTWNLDHNCKPTDLLQVTGIDKKILSLVEYNLTWPSTRPHKGLVLCPYAYGIYDLIQPLINNRGGNYKSEMLNIWTMLSLNPEPIIIQVVILKFCGSGTLDIHK